jgi:hypothetical protein
MPTGQQYATNVPQTTITGQINPTATVMSVASSASWPATPFTAILDIATSLQEPVDVTNITGTTWTIVRAIDGTVGFTHQVNATVTHGDIGRDFREARTHIDSSQSVHGLQGGSSVVGTLDIQTLSQKTLNSPAFNGAVGMGTGAWTGTGSLTEPVVGVSGLTGATTATRIAGGTGGGPPASGTFVTGDVVADTANAALWICTSGGTSGTWIPVGGRARIFSTSGASASYNFSIPSSITANRIEVYWRGKSTAAIHNGSLNLQLNSDTGTNYQFERLEAQNGTVASAINVAQTFMQVSSIGGTLSTANYKASGTFIIEGVTDTTGFPMVLGTGGLFDVSGNAFTGVFAGQHLASGGVTSFQLFPSSGWDANSYMAVYAVY